MFRRTEQELFHQAAQQSLNDEAERDRWTHDDQSALLDSLLLLEDLQKESSNGDGDDQEVICAIAEKLCWIQRKLRRVIELTATQSNSTSPLPQLIELNDRVSAALSNTNTQIASATGVSMANTGPPSIVVILSALRRGGRTEVTQAASQLVTMLGTINKSQVGDAQLFDCNYSENLTRTTAMRDLRAAGAMLLCA
jgi:hypothetical protein